MKTHLSLSTTDLGKSIAFYRTLLNARPAKEREDYALFVVDDPGIELALDLAPSAQTRDMHFGICVDSVAEVESAIERLGGAGLVSSVERNENCCYANQTKVWATDPDGRRWEVYTVHEDTNERNGDDMQCCSSDGEQRACSAT